MVKPRLGAAGLPKASAGTEFAPAPLTTDDVLRHPRFPLARDHYMRVMVASHSANRAIQHLMHDIARNVLFNVILGHNARELADDPNTWLSVGKLRALFMPFGLASPRSFDQMLARMQSIGLLSVELDPSDRRRKLIRPTAKMIAEDLQWIDDHMSPLAVLFPESDEYEPARLHDIDFQRAQRAISTLNYDKTLDILSVGEPALQLLLRQDASKIIYSYLLQALDTGNQYHASLSYEHAAKQLSTSRTHVRNLLRDMETLGLLQARGRGGNDVMLLPALWHTVEVFLAKCMAGHDNVWQLARQIVIADTDDAKDHAEVSNILGSASALTA